MEISWLKKRFVTNEPLATTQETYQCRRKKREKERDT
jgi:hypothetical protein